MKNKLKQKRRKWFGPSFKEIMEEFKEEMAKDAKKLFNIIYKKYKEIGYDEQHAKQLALRDTKLVVIGGAVKAGIPIGKEEMKKLKIKDVKKQQNKKKTRMK